PVYQLAGADVELREMQRALHPMAVEPAARQRRVAVSADIADRVETRVNMGEQHAVAVDRDAFHAARRDVGDLRDLHEAVHGCVAHSTPSLVMPGLFRASTYRSSWVAGTSPAMTNSGGDANRHGRVS